MRILEEPVFADDFVAEPISPQARHGQTHHGIGAFKVLVDQIKELILSGLPGSQVQVDTDGYHYQVTVISDQFDGLSRVKRQQAVYACIRHLIDDGTLHSVPMQTFTPGEWQSRQG